jgi:hypothetical protein
MEHPSDGFKPDGFPNATYNARVPKDFSNIGNSVRANSSNEYFAMTDVLRGVLSGATALVVRRRGCILEEIWNFMQDCSPSVKDLMKMSELRKKIADDPDIFFTHIVERELSAHINIYTSWRANDLNDLFVIHIKYDPAVDGTFTFAYSCNNPELAVYPQVK